MGMPHAVCGVGNRHGGTGRRRRDRRDGRRMVAPSEEHHDCHAAEFQPSHLVSHVVPHVRLIVADIAVVAT